MVFFEILSKLMYISFSIDSRCAKVGKYPATFRYIVND